MRRLRSVSMVCICRYSDRRMVYIKARILLLLLLAISGYGFSVMKC